jgi:hypothetical protein
MCCATSLLLQSMLLEFQYVRLMQRQQQLHMFDMAQVVWRSAYMPQLFDTIDRHQQVGISFPAPPVLLFPAQPALNRHQCGKHAIDSPSCTAAAGPIYKSPVLAATAAVECAQLTTQHCSIASCVVVLLQAKGDRIAAKAAAKTTAEAASSAALQSAANILTTSVPAQHISDMVSIQKNPLSFHLCPSLSYAACTALHCLVLACNCA